MPKSAPAFVAMCLASIYLHASGAPDTVNVPIWLPDQQQGGWHGNHNSTIEKDAAGLILKSGDESYYGSVFRSVGEVDIDQCPFFVVDVDRAEGAFGCKLINGAKRDKQVIFRPTPGDRCFMTHLPSQTGWSGKIPLAIGIYCHGEDRSLRVKSIQFMPEPTKEVMDRFDQVRNLIFNSSFELDTPGRPPIQTWHRLGNYLRDETPWRVSAIDVYHGDRCVATEKPGKFVLQREIHSPAARVYTFSAYMKAAKPGHKARLAVTTYRQGRPFNTRTEAKEVTVSGKWARYHMTIDVPVVRNRGLLGATDLTIESLEHGQLRVDALQLEIAQKPTMYGRNRGLFMCRQRPNLRSPLYPTVAEPAQPDELPRCPLGTIPLSPLGGVLPPAQGWPMIGTVTVPQGQTFDISSWRLKTAEGDCLPAQTRVLARWQGDGSIKAGQITAEADGSAHWVLEYNSKALMPPIETPLAIGRPATVGEVCSVVSVDGRTFTNEPKPKLLRLEEAGPLRFTVCAEGEHLAPNGDQLLSYVVRMHGYHNRCLMRTEYTWVNTNASPCVTVNAIALRIPLGPRVQKATLFGHDGRTHEIEPAVGGSLLQCNEGRRYFYELRRGDSAPQRIDGKAQGRVRLDLGDRVLHALVEDWWQNHPMELAVDAEGATIYFWSPRVKAVQLTRGMAKTHTVTIWHGPKAEAPKCMAGPTQLVPPSEVHCRSGVFGGAILPSKDSPFPIFEKAVNSRACLARMSPDVMLATDSFGQFNYGDCMGDGGWGNLETQRGHAAWVHYLRTGNPRMFAVAQAAARHYRDIDIDQFSGAAITHNPSHTLGGKSTSHAWIQSLLDHYLTTGERRSMEVALLHAAFLKNLPASKLVHGGRAVTRVLDNMADLYMLTGDEELVQQYHKIVAEQRDSLKRAKTKFPGIFQHERYEQWTYPANFVPWYGLYSQVKMRLATGDAAWEKALQEELKCAMDKLPFEYAWPCYFEGNELPDDERIVRCLAEGAIGDRGSMLFAPLGYGYRWTRDRRYLDIGMATTYIAIISREFQDPLYALAAIFLEQAREAGLGAADEQRYYGKAIDIMKRAARPTLSNPGFEEGREDWRAWSVKPATSSFWVPVRDKCLIPDPSIKKEGKHSLHVVIRRKCPPWGSGVPLDSEYFVLDEAKTYALEGWVRTTGQVGASVYLSVRPLSADVDPEGFRAELGAPGTDGWRRWGLKAQAQADSLARLRLNIGRSHAKAEGDAWWDGIALTKK